MLIVILHRELLKEVILGGGGHHNPALVSMLEAFVSPARVMTHEDVGISSDFKEALVFAVLAHETWAWSYRDDSGNYGGASRDYRRADYAGERILSNSYRAGDDKQVTLFEPPSHKGRKEFCKNVIRGI